MNQVLDKHVREMLHDYLQAGLAAASDVRVIDELPVSAGWEDGRVDVVVVNSHMHGYEIKSDADDLERLAKRQIRIYSKVMDFVSIVVTSKHVKAAEKIIPAWWGLLEYRHCQPLNRASYGSIFEHRPSAVSPEVDVKWLVRLLWRNHAVELLKKMNSATGVSGKAKGVLHSRILEACSPEEIHTAVCNQFKEHRRCR